MVEKSNLDQAARAGADDQLCAAAEDLTSHLRGLGPDVHIAQRLLQKHPTTKYGV
ncbi:hypothetical protein [Mycolicibacterium parafortuitum]|uniref:Uncharacterized protein n=1 Tax=Mycolicibacterium parafortuitum TaxID=39692 RepID=A0A375YK54_MYCPF|nr:hypothetical protein [Mycolicibacterium parafortuitum]SRX81501.1 hypothetical protein MPP7335_03253 [Mycolicibacterium parafortuitum]